MAAGPEPKDAMTAGAHAVARLVPYRLRTAGVSTTTAKSTGTCDLGPSTSRSRAGKPCALSAAHIAGSQETPASGLTCPATQLAACSMAAARFCGWAVGAPGERTRYRVIATPSNPA